MNGFDVLEPLIGRLVLEAAKVEFHLDDFLWRHNQRFYESIEACSKAGVVKVHNKIPASIEEKFRLFAFILEKEDEFAQIRDAEGKIDFNNISNIAKEVFRARNYVVHGCVDLARNEAGGRNRFRARKYRPDRKIGNLDQFWFSEELIRSLLRDLRYLKVLLYEVHRIVGEAEN